MKVTDLTKTPPPISWREGDILNTAGGLRMIVRDFDKYFAVDFQGKVCSGSYNNPKELVYKTYGNSCKQLKINEIILEAK